MSNTRYAWFYNAVFAFQKIKKLYVKEGNASND
jgi:hypothetical protein